MKTAKHMLIFILLLSVGNFADAADQIRPEQIITPSAAGTSAQAPSDWDDGAPYHALKKGTKIVYTYYDGKGHVTGYSNQEILKITHAQNSVEAVVSGTQTDRKGKIQSSGTVSLRYKNGNFHVDLLDIMQPQQMQAIDTEVEASGRDMIIPGKLSPGQALPDAQTTFKMKVKTGGTAFDLPSLTFRVFNRRAVQAESVETPMGTFSCFKITQTVEADYPLIGKQLFTSITWIGKGIGVIKTETYDKKGKLQSRMLLTELK